MANSRSSVLSRPAPSLGCETPRIFTLPLRPLTPRTSLGFALIDFARDVLGMELLPWQQWLAIHALELLPDGTFRFRTVVLLVARQNGKSTFLQILALFFLYVRGVSLVIGTAQNLDIAEEVWQGAVDIAQDVPELADEIERVVMVNGKKALELRHGERYKVQAANRRGGRGLSGDLVLLDELREHQSWDAWGAITKTTMARAHAMTWAVSNAGDSSSVVLAFLRRLAHEALGDPDGLAEEQTEDVPEDVEDLDESLGIFEWSAPPGCDLRDRDGWAQANPSRGHTITDRAIGAALRTDPEAVFRTEVLCQWVSALVPSAISADSWATRADPAAAPGARPVFAVAVAPDRSWAAIGSAYRRPDQLVQVRLADYRRGTAWISDRVTELRAKWGGTFVLAYSARGLVDADTLKQNEQVLAEAGLVDAVVAGTLRHSNEPALTMAVTNARWMKSGFEPLADIEITPARAVAVALHALSSDSGAAPNLW